MLFSALRQPVCLTGGLRAFFVIFGKETEKMSLKYTYPGRVR